MNQSTKTIGGSLLGISLAAATTYLLDPDNGRQRRSVLADRCKNAATRVNEQTRVARHDLSHRYDDLSARAKTWFNRNQNSDMALSKRVRSAVWRNVPQAGKVGVVAHNGQVILHGDVFPEKHEQVVRAARDVNGVASIADHLIETEEEDVPLSRNARSGVRQRFVRARDNVLQERWSPPTRMISGLAGTALIRYGSRHHDVLGVLGALTGAALLFRGATNIPLKRVPGMRRRAAVDVREELEEAAEEAPLPGSSPSGNGNARPAY
jgi:gas vesicle protein